MRNSSTHFFFSGFLYICALIGVPIYVSSFKITGTFEGKGQGFARVLLAPTIEVDREVDSRGNVKRKLEPDWEGKSGKKIIQGIVKAHESDPTNGMRGTYTLDIEDPEITYMWAVRLNEPQNIFELQRQTKLQNGETLLQGMYENVRADKVVNIALTHQAEECKHVVNGFKWSSAPNVKPSELSKQKEMKDLIIITMTTPPKAAESLKPQEQHGQANAPKSVADAPNGEAEAPKSEADASAIQEPAPAAAPKARKARPMNRALADRLKGTAFDAEKDSAAKASGENGAARPKPIASGVSVADRAKAVQSSISSFRPATVRNGTEKKDLKTEAVGIRIQGVTGIVDNLQRGPAASAAPRGKPIVGKLAEKAGPWANAGADDKATNGVVPAKL